MAIKGTIQERFERFNTENPIVYETLVRLARHAKSKGHRKMAIGMLWERLRWEFMIEAKDNTSKFKLNDHYRSRYARLIMEQEEDLESFFEIRVLRELRHVG